MVFFDTPVATTKRSVVKHLCKYLAKRLDGDTDNCRIAVVWFICKQYDWHFRFRSIFLSWQRILVPCRQTLTKTAATLHVNHRTKDPLCPDSIHISQLFQKQCLCNCSQAVKIPFWLTSNTTKQWRQTRLKNTQRYRSKTENAAIMRATSKLCFAFKCRNHSR